MSSDRRKDDRHRELGPQHGRPHVVVRHRDRATRRKTMSRRHGNCGQCVFAVRSAVDVVEEALGRSRRAAPPEILDVDDA